MYNSQLIILNKNPFLVNEFMMTDFTIDSIGSIKICQPKKGYRFSVDALILADFVNLKRIKRIVDLGAGTGIVGIILAKKYPESKVTLIEIQRELADLALESVRLNNLDAQVSVSCLDGRDYEEEGIDVLVTNPPFRRPGTGKLSPDNKKALARHELSLSILDIAKVAQKLLRVRGRLFMIHLPERLIEIVRIFSKHRLEVKRLRFVHSRLDSEAKMVLIEAVKEGKSALTVEPPLFIYEKNGEYSEEMKRIYNI